VAGERSRTSTWSAPAPSEDRRPQPGASPRPRERRLHRRPRYSGPRALLAHWPKWIRLRRRLKRAPASAATTSTTSSRSPSDRSCCSRRWTRCSVSPATSFIESSCPG
jgi:hypothetical protein